MITLQQMRFLVAVADTLNFSRAADLCFVTQPTLSAGIKELEERLGAQLIERTRRKVMLTPLGADVAQRARALLLDAQEIETLARAHRQPDQGDLRLGAIPTVGPYLIPQALPAIRRRFPNLKVYLREEITENLIAGLTGGRLDVILIALPFDIGTLEYSPLFEDGYQLATPLHDLARPGQNLLQDGGQLMLLEKGHCLQRHALQAYPGRHLEQDESFAATSLQTLVSMVSEGLGITLLPNLAIDAGTVVRGEVRLTPLPDACPRTVVLAWRPSSARKTVFQQIADVLKEARDNQRAAAERPS
ncbi:LysR substrate-binding domain-containing protein [Mesobacterium sp. TK19101]|uniref:LysR substrate-binding domain-containing protein n=1 Tax=Mesobacterium hydrothermale TaxID=3111907 RepID=A0ABU6HDA3_9RHOB|nr:LysR substrate-binding domain-containing protein [Mesobacterium sp. TK19101]MEC3860430.1 LysR substrate-binding domain-containing protein [Mesobacterium sp. TK19101]